MAKRPPVWRHELPDFSNDISDSSSDDSFMVYKNMQMIPNIPLPKFKKPRNGKLFKRQSPSGLRISPSAILRAFGKRNEFVKTSTPYHRPSTGAVPANPFLLISPIQGKKSTNACNEHEDDHASVNNTKPDKDTDISNSLNNTSRRKSKKHVSASVYAITEQLLKLSESRRKENSEKNKSMKENLKENSNNLSHTKNGSPINGRKKQILKEHSSNSLRESIQNQLLNNNQSDLAGIGILAVSSDTELTSRVKKGELCKLRHMPNRKTILREIETQTTDSLEKMSRNKFLNRTPSMEEENTNNHKRNAKRKIIDSNKTNSQKKTKSVLSPATGSQQINVESNGDKRTEKQSSTSSLEGNREELQRDQDNGNIQNQLPLLLPNNSPSELHTEPVNNDIEENAIVEEFLCKFDARLKTESILCISSTLEETSETNSSNMVDSVATRTRKDTIVINSISSGNTSKSYNHGTTEKPQIINTTVNRSKAKAKNHNPTITNEPQIVNSTTSVNTRKTNAPDTQISASLNDSGKSINPASSSNVTKSTRGRKKGSKNKKPSKNLPVRAKSSASSRFSGYFDVNNATQQTEENSTDDTLAKRVRRPRQQFIQAVFIQEVETISKKKQQSSNRLSMELFVMPSKPVRKPGRPSRVSTKARCTSQSGTASTPSKRLGMELLLEPSKPARKRGRPSKVSTKARRTTRCGTASRPSKRLSMELLLEPNGRLSSILENNADQSANASNNEPSTSKIVNHEQPKSNAKKSVTRKPKELSTLAMDEMPPIDTGAHLENDNEPSTSNIRSKRGRKAKAKISVTKPKDLSTLAMDETPPIDTGAHLENHNEPSTSNIRNKRGRKSNPKISVSRKSKELSSLAMDETPPIHTGAHLENDNEPSTSNGENKKQPKSNPKISVSRKSNELSTLAMDETPSIETGAHNLGTFLENHNELPTSDGRNKKQPKSNRVTRKPNDLSILAIDESPLLDTGATSLSTILENDNEPSISNIVKKKRPKLTQIHQSILKVAETTGDDNSTVLVRSNCESANTNTRQPCTSKSMVNIEECLQSQDESMFVTYEEPLNTNVLHTVINNQVTTLNWINKNSKLDSTKFPREGMAIHYIMKNVQSSFNTSSFGHMILAPKYKTPLQLSKKHCFAYKVEEGEAVVHVDQIRKSVEAGDMFYIPLGVRYKIVNTTNQHLIIYFTSFAST